MQDSSSDGPLISVCMPVYNAERYVGQAVESILNQTLGDFEFLIVDDGSTDGSRRVLESYAARDRRIRLSSRPNTGLLVALHEMLAMARGEFLARMDADDVALPERFERQVAYLRSHPEVLALGTRILVIDPDGDPLEERCLGRDHEEIDRAHIEPSPEMGICHPSVMMRTETLRRIGGYRPEYDKAEDTDLWLRLGELGRLANLPDVHLKYRLHPQSVSQSKGAEQYTILVRAQADARRRRGLPPSQAPEFIHQAEPLDESGWWHFMGWMALKSGHVSTARKYGLRLCRRRPSWLESWRLLYCALRGY
jgi:glycosyltransferase involved in cell wall biosynthesis